ncbi:MAG: hypothetical protein IJU44_07215, partial [Kiritimatiellae bacterium]|nr:hypothetical protein [Kiritimatiellia bacterium]
LQESIQPTPDFFNPLFSEKNLGAGNFMAPSGHTTNPRVLRWKPARAYHRMMLFQFILVFCGCVNLRVPEPFFNGQCTKDGISLNVDRLNDREWELHFSGEYEFVVAGVNCCIYEWRKERLPFDNPERHDVEWHVLGFSAMVDFMIIEYPLKCGCGGLRRDFRRLWNLTLNTPEKRVALNGNTSTVVFRVRIVKSNRRGDEFEIEFVFGRPLDPGTVLY